MEKGRNYRIGNFTEKVDFLYPKGEETESGAVEFEYLVFASRLCEMQDTTLSGSIENESVTYTQSYSAVTWDVKGVTTDWKARYKGDMYFIDSIRVAGRDITRYELRRVDICS